MTYRTMLGAVLGAMAVALAAAWPGAAQAAEGGVSIELNKLEPLEDRCRAYLVLENGMESRFETLTLDLVMFDPEGVVAKRLAVEVAPLAPGKTRLKVFDMEGLSCGGISRVLLNDVLECRNAAGAVEGCLADLAVSSRAGLDFFK